MSSAPRRIGNFSYEVTTDPDAFVKLEGLDVSRSSPVAHWFISEFVAHRKMPIEPLVPSGSQPGFLEGSKH